MSELKITHSLPKDTRDIDWYIGKQTTIHFTLNNQHDCEITLKLGWEQEDFIQSIQESFMAVLFLGEHPESIHITKLEEDITSLN